MAEPIITGSFCSIQHTNIWNAQYWNDECRDWTEANWRAFIAHHDEVGIDTLIISQMAVWSLPLFPDAERRVGLPLKLGCEDPAAVIADEAARRGMKVFFGLGIFGRGCQVRDYAKFDKPWPDEWFAWHATLAEAVMARYSGMDAFAGVFVSVELGRDRVTNPCRFNPVHMELYGRLVKDTFRPIVGRTPVLASPGILAPGDYGELERQLAQCDIDIIAYQDYGGRGQDRPEDYDRIDQAAEAFELLTKVHRNAGVKLWANCETFSRCTPPTWRPVTFPGYIERIKHQLKVCSPPVEKVISWAYQGVWNRRTELVNIGPPEADRLHRQMVEYLKDSFPQRYTGPL